jgi:hypothetical protein
VHQFDIWHLAKCVTKKLGAKAKSKDAVDLSLWIHAISNHLWWSSQTCGGNHEVLLEKWNSVVHHTVGKHEWDGFKYFSQCAHPPLDREESRQKLWLEPGSPSREALKKVVFDKRLQKDIKKLSDFHHTGELEVFHSLLTKYCPKREHFHFEECLFGQSLQLWTTTSMWEGNLLLFLGKLPLQVKWEK